MANIDVMYSSKSNEWATPQAFFDELNTEFGFTLDPCATHENAKCPKYYTIEEDGLEQDWQGETVFCNPPYGKEIGKWIAKCAHEAKKITPKSSCSFLRELTPARFTNTYTEKPSSVSSKAA